MMANPPSPLQPTWRGHISSTMDALTLFEACLEGRLNHVPRRPHDRERDELIRSGNVFIYEEHSSGIKRWTDGYNWSPSRILGNFLIYRELEHAFPPGEKKKAMKKKLKNGNGTAKQGDATRLSPANVAAAASTVDMASDPQNESHRALIGSLVDSYPFKENGLVKKTISVHWNGVPHHLVSYYKVADVLAGNLPPPSRTASLRGIIPRSGLISTQNFRVPVDQDEFSIDHEGRRWPLYYNQHPLGNSPYPMMAYRAQPAPEVPMNMSPYGNGQYTIAPGNIHPDIATTVAPHMGLHHGLPSVAVADGHYAYDPIRHGMQRHSISGAELVAANEYARHMELEQHQDVRRASVTSYETAALRAAESDAAEMARMSRHVRPLPMTTYNTTTLGATASSATDVSGIISPTMSQDLGLDDEGRGVWQMHYADYGAEHQHADYSSGQQSPDYNAGQQPPHGAGQQPPNNVGQQTFLITPESWAAGRGTGGSSQH